MFQYKQLNNYVLLKIIGQGSFGEVHLAESANKKQYALKIIPVTNQNKEHAKKQARMCISFDHPNILNAQEVFFFEQEKYLVIVLEYCPGGNLHSLIGKIDHNKCKEFMIQVAEGLNYLHEEKKTLHRDIKPENILMSNEAPKIADFGIAKIMKPEGLSSKSCTIQYAAPEFLNEEKYNFPADIWSLGTVFLELLLGKRIKDLVKGELSPGFRNKFPFEDLLGQIKEENLRELVRKMLDKNPEQRLTSRQVLEWLKGPEIKNVRIDQREELININQKQFIELLQENVLFPNLTHFYFQNCQLTDQSIVTLLKIPLLNHKFPKLLCFDFSYNQITDVGLKALGKAAGYFNNLQEISLNSNRITDIGLKTLADSADQFKNLQIIDFSNNQITDAGLKSLAYASFKLKNLQEICLSSNQITDIGLKTLADFADQFKNLQIIRLDDNLISDVGLKALTGAAWKLKNLQEISLNSNQITDVGLKALAVAADQFKNLQDIGLNNNHITDEGLKALADAAGQFKNLKWIYLNNNNKITDDGLKALVDAAGQFKNLQLIGLSDNQITDVGLKALADAAGQLTSLQKVSLMNNKVTQQGLNALKQKYNNHLKIFF